MNQCKVVHCELLTHAKGYCRPHYRRWWDGKNIEAPLQKRNYTRKPCLVPNCNRVCTNNEFCRECNQRWRYSIGPVAPLKEKHSCIDSQGYERWNICHPKNIWGRQIPAHRAVMQLHLGRDLFKNENVHHINGNRQDNRLENLELWNTSQPPGQRVEDKIKWAEELLRQYGRLPQ